VDEDTEFVDTIIWSDDATFKPSGRVNGHNFLNRSSENLTIHVDKPVNLPGLTFWYGASSRGIVVPYFIHGRVIDTECFNILEVSIASATHQLWAMRKFSGHPSISNVMSGNISMTIPQTGG
jgi:hypothetical protein